MRYEKEDSGYNEYNIEWQKDISFHWNKQVDKKYQRNNNARRSQNDIKKTICDLSGSKKYAHGRLKQPANKAALTPMEPYSNKEANDISAPKIASTPQGIRAAMIPNTERII